jgi:hypothetical protein
MSLLLYPRTDANFPAQAHEILMEFRSLLFRGFGKKSDLASTLQAAFPHLSVQSCKVSCKVFAAEMGHTMKRTLSR